jgi:hypothetical protein
LCAIALTAVQFSYIVDIVDFWHFVHLPSWVFCCYL